MAKKVVKEVSSSADDIFGMLVAQHNKRSNGIATLGSKMESEITHWIDSGSMLLNMVLSNKPDGGWPAGRVVEVYGPESIGKSTLGYVAMANCQKAGGIPIYADVERAGNKTFMSMLGVDLDRIITTHEETVELLFASLEENLKLLIERGLNKNPNIIVVDSVAALQTDAELEQGYEYNMNIQMKKAMMLGKALKKIVPVLSKANCCLYLVNQVRDNTSGYGEKHVVPGGRAIPFYSSIRVHLKGQEKVIGRDPELERQFQEANAAYKALSKEERIGIDKPERVKSAEATLGFKVEAFTKKNKTCPPQRTAYFEIIFSEGLVDVRSFFTECLKVGILKKMSTQYEFANQRIKDAYPELGKFFESRWEELILTKDGLYEMVYQALVEKLTIQIGPNTKFSTDGEEDGDASGDYSEGKMVMVSEKLEKGTFEDY